ncbi:MAG: hypothetical protein M3O74_05545 [Pseudomonadota bacterium]|nr:hypothetical protein [Pseudomonadota bacterium]
MSSTPRELIDCAALMLSAAKDEPSYRAVCSRAYYAAYHAAYAFHSGLPQPGSVGSATGKHAQLIAQLANPQCGKQNKKFAVSQALGKTMRLLLDARVKADYSIHLEVNQVLAADTTTGAELVVQRSA